MGRVLRGIIHRNDNSPKIPIKNLRGQFTEKAIHLKVQFTA